MNRSCLSLSLSLALKKLGDLGGQGCTAHPVVIRSYLTGRIEFLGDEEIIASRTRFA